MKDFPHRKWAQSARHKKAQLNDDPLPFNATVALAMGY